MSQLSIGHLLLLLMLFSLYFVPVFVSWARNHSNTPAILIINLFLGWTGLAWVICLAWACMPDRNGERR